MSRPPAVGSSACAVSGALYCRDPDLQRDPQFVEAVAFRRGAFNDRILEASSIGSNRYREYDPDRGSLRLIAALGGSDLMKQCAGAGCIALHAALQETRENLAMAAAAGAGAGFDVPRRVTRNDDQPVDRLYGPRSRYAAAIRPS
jgi:hypothetical protein